MKKIFSLLIIAFLFFQVSAQVTMKAIVTSKFSSFREGDTVNLYGYKRYENSNSEEFLVKIKNDYRSVSTQKFKVIKPIDDFWERLWFFQRATDVITDGWDKDIREKLLNDSRDFVQNLQKNKLFLEDDYLQDYLSQMVHKICPFKLNKPKNGFLTIYVMKSNEAKSFSFDNGTIIITTGLLSSFKNERELANVLSKEISNIVLDNNLLNVKQQIRSQRITSFWTAFADVISTAAAVNSYANHNDNFTFDDARAVTAATNLISQGIMESVGSNYSNEQIGKSFSYAGNFLSTQYDTWDHKTPDEFNRILSNAIGFSAWQNFYEFNYSEAINLINRLENSGIAVEEDYLLKAKIYRTIYNTDESNYEALRCIKTAKGIGLTKLIELSKEEGLLYLRLNDKAKAKIALEEYKNGLIELNSRGEDSSGELKWVLNTMYKNNL